MSKTSEYASCEMIDRSLDRSVPHRTKSEAMRLSSRCVLVLGKEKEGIPVDILQEVDECIEIPQFGITRSLNVHVSAALAIWEITKQNVEFLTQSSK